MTSPEVPKGVFKPGDENRDITSVAFAGKDTLLTGTLSGVVCAWNIADQRCFMHWQADNSEICMLHCFPLYIKTKKLSLDR